MTESCLVNPLGGKKGGKKVPFKHTEITEKAYM